MSGPPTTQPLCVGYVTQQRWQGHAPFSEWQSCNEGHFHFLGKEDIVAVCYVCKGEAPLTHDKHMIAYKYFFRIVRLCFWANRTFAINAMTNHSEAAGKLYYDNANWLMPPREHAQLMIAASLKVSIL